MFPDWGYYGLCPKPSWSASRSLCGPSVQVLCLLSSMWCSHFKTSGTCAASVALTLRGLQDSGSAEGAWGGEVSPALVPLLPSVC